MKKSRFTETQMRRSAAYTLEDMKAIARNRGGKCLSRQYKNVKTRMLWECRKGHQWDQTPDKIINRRQWCPRCSKFGRMTIVDMQEIAIRKGGKCLSKKYVNDSTKLKWECGKGHKWMATPNSVKFKSWCPKCAGSFRLTLKEMQKLAKERGGKCLSKTYKNTSTKLKWECKQGHQWKAVVPLVRRGTWCPKCSEGLGERICRTHFEQIFKRKFPKQRPKWLVNRAGNQMELDGYCKTIGVAFEHQGEQHLRPHPRFHTKISFAKRVADDRLKVSLCKEHGVHLIQVPEIPQYLKLAEVKDFIIGECKKYRIKALPKHAVKIEISLRKAYVPNSNEYLREIKSIARSKGGACLSKAYIGAVVKLEFKCRKGHRWKATPQHIRNGTWCPDCGGTKRGTIAQMKALAMKHGGKCLSSVYRNENDYLSWQCKKGHQWDVGAASVKNGHWCPVCEGRVRPTIEDMRTLAESFGGECLSKIYKNTDTHLRWRCRDGHIWEARPAGVKRGAWCAKCAGVAKGTIDEMRELAVAAGGKCLSEKYISVNSPLRWECDEGHIWQATPNTMKQRVRRRGYWCKECKEK